MAVPRRAVPAQEILPTLLSGRSWRTNKSNRRHQGHDCARTREEIQRFFHFFSPVHGIWSSALGSCTWWCVVAVDVLTHAPCVLSCSQRCPTPVTCPPREMVSWRKRCSTSPATCPPRDILVVPARVSFSSWLLWCASRDWLAVREEEHLRWKSSKDLSNSNFIMYQDTEFYEFLGRFGAVREGSTGV